MRLILLLTLEGAEHYGYIPFFKEGYENTTETDNRVEEFELDEGDEDLLDEDFVIPIDDLCDALIGPTDIDYLNADQCRLMLGWLERRVTEPIHPRLETLYRKLIEFAGKAIELNTGIVFDL